VDGRRRLPLRAEPWHQQQPGRDDPAGDNAEALGGGASAPGGMACCVAVSSLERVRLQLEQVRGAVNAIDRVFLDTLALPCPALGQVLGCSVTLKVETLNPVRSFKGRGTETVAAVARRAGASRVVCASAGNLGQALAYSGSRRGLEVTVVAARTANALKLRQIAALGAGIRLAGEDIEDARVLAREIADADGAYLVEDSLDLATCEGAATIGLELVRDDPRLDVVLVALGGGAMASGVGYVVRSLADQVEVVGIQPVGAPAMALSWRQGTVVETHRIETIAMVSPGAVRSPKCWLTCSSCSTMSCSCARTRSRPGCVRCMSTRGSWSSRPRRSGLPPSSSSLSGSPGGASPRSCAEATWGLPISHGGCWNQPRVARASAAYHTRDRTGAEFGGHGDMSEVPAITQSERL
jgi:threonine dehydratase